MPPLVTDQRNPTMEEGLEKIGKGDVLPKLKRESRKWQ